MLIREITVDDAAAFLALKTQLDRETSFMMYEPGERRTTVDEEAAGIRSMLSAGNQTAIVAEDDGRLVGYVGVEGGVFRRNRHVACIVVGVLREFAGRGIGRELFEKAGSWAKAHGLHRLELTVMTHNTAAVRLYRKLGFEFEGTRHHAMLVDGEYVDEFYMARLVD